jgi:penicillin-binding protein 2
MDERHRDHALYAAFAPLQSPKIALAIVVENAGFEPAPPPSPPRLRLLLAAPERGHIAATQIDGADRRAAPDRQRAAAGRPSMARRRRGPSRLPTPVPAPPASTAADRPAPSRFRCRFRHRHRLRRRLCP